MIETTPSPVVLKPFPPERHSPGEREVKAMRTLLSAVVVCAVLSAAPVSSNAAAPAAEREEINKTFELSPGARVDVSSISGPVDVEVTGSSTAEVHIVRSARSRAELDCVPMTVEGGGSSLTIRVQQDRGAGCRDIRRSDRVRLLLPASVNFKASSVSGDVTIGRLEGTVSLHSISGDVRVGGVSGELDVSSVSGSVTVDQATGYSKISSVSGSVLVSIAELGDRGITASSISGDVELRFGGSVDADVTVDSISGQVSSEMADMTVTKVSESSFRGRLGGGGTRISLSSISGDVRFTRR
jgi:hypothetical protein